MKIGTLLKRLFERIIYGRGYGIAELARRLDIDKNELRAVEPAYYEFTISKRSGGVRRITAPDSKLKRIQRRVLQRLLRRLRSHPAATGFERGQSIVTNARQHTGQAVVVCMDLKDFFQSTHADRLAAYFRKIGWNRQATSLLVRLCTHQGVLPQGAPTSPRLSNLVNYRLDARLAGIADKLGATYTRYADDLTFSFPVDEPKMVRLLISITKRVVGDVGYRLHHRKKLHIRRAHQCQVVTGLVVNASVNLPRLTRRWLRAVEHRARQRENIDVFTTSGLSARRPTLTASERAGWHALQTMIVQQSNSIATAGK